MSEALYLMLRAAGDTVISLGLLESLPQEARLEILGTEAAAGLAATLRLQRFTITPILPDVAAVFDLKKAGPRRAVADAIKIRAALRARAAPGRQLFLEHRDWRNRWLVPGASYAVREPARGHSIYADRQAMLSRAFGVLAPLARAPLPREVRRVVLNPGSRVPAKVLPAPIVESVVAYCEARNLELTLLDPARDHAALALRVNYLPAPPLAEAIAALRGCDLYIGADSLFLHLAYRFGRPAFVIAQQPDLYFALPGSTPESVISFTEALKSGALAAGLDRYCRGSG